MTGFDSLPVLCSKVNAAPIEKRLRKKENKMKASYDVIDGIEEGKRVFRFFRASSPQAGWIENEVVREGNVVLPEDKTLEEAVSQAIEAGILAPS